MPTVTRPYVSTCRQRSGWNHHTPGLRRLAPGFLAVDRLHRSRIGSILGQPSRDAQSTRRSPSLCLQDRDALLHRIPNVIPPYTSAPRNVSVRVRPLLLCHQPEVPHSRRATGQQSAFNNPARLPVDRKLVRTSFPRRLPLASFGQGKMEDAEQIRKRSLIYAQPFNR